MKHLLSLLDASLSVFFRVIRENLAKLIAVFLPLNLLLTYVHSQLSLRFAAGSDLPLGALKSSGSFERIYGLIFGLFAFLIVVRMTWHAVEKPTDRNEPAGTDGEAWGRVFGTNLLLLLTAAAALATPYVAFLVCKDVHVAGLIAGGAVLCICIVLLLRLCLATRLSALFRLNPIEALKASFSITRRHVGTLFAIEILSTLITCSLIALPECLYLCDVFGFLHPFSAEGPTTRRIVCVLHAVLGTTVSVLMLYPATALTLFLRERLEDPTDDDAAKPLRAAALALLGVVLVAGAGISFARKESSVYRNRIYRPENMEKTKTDVKAAFDFNTIHLAPGGAEAIGDAAVEKPTLFDRFGRGRIIWCELPFCSRCKSWFDDAGSCDRHELDTYAYKCVFFSEHSGSKTACVTPAGFARLLPTDVQHPMTDEEKTKTNELLKKRLANKTTPAAN